MGGKKTMKRLITICALCAAFCISVNAGNFFLIIREGRICYQDVQSGQWTDTGCRIGAGERALLENGLYFPGRAALTRALEDFCS